ncbi:MAG: acyl-CoA dehydrogenase family protein [Actinomycetota bacterium]|nr:acyl-CoA dehydrogenase family protein [Actinomycetota bacterium]
MTTPTDTQQASDTPQQASFRAAVRRFLAANSELKGATSPWRLTFHASADDARRDFERGCAWQKKRYDAGMTAFTYPKEYGGQDGEAWQERIYNEEARDYAGSSGFIGSSIQMLGPTLMAYGTEEQKRELLPRLHSGQDRWCQLFSEPGSGSDLASLGCRAVRDGDEFVVTGQKVWNSAAQWCDHGFLLVRTSPDKPKHQGITFLLIDMHAPGVEVRPLVQATGAAHFNEVFLEEVRVPVANVLGQIDGGWAVARTVLANEAAMIGGSGNKTFPVLRLLAERYGRTDDALIRQRLAEYFTREKVIDLMAERILTAVRRREKPPIDPSILKLYMTASRARSGELATAIAGADGVLMDDEVQRWVGAELVGRYSVSIGGGTTEVQKNNLAERALGLPREPGYDRDLPWSRIPRS